MLSNFVCFFSHTGGATAARPAAQPGPSHLVNQMATIAATSAPSYMQLTAASRVKQRPTGNL